MESVWLGWISIDATPLDDRRWYDDEIRFSHNLHNNKMKFSQAVSLLTTLSIAVNGVMAFAAVADKSCAAGGAGVHVPIGKDGEGEYTASTKGWCVIVLPS